VGFEKLGWNPDQQPLFTWLAKHLIAFLVRSYPDQYGTLISASLPSEDGSVFTDDLTV
jgi:hypothetical protein